MVRPLTFSSNSIVRFSALPWVSEKRLARAPLSVGNSTNSAPSVIGPPPEISVSKVTPPEISEASDEKSSAAPLAPMEKVKPEVSQNRVEVVISRS